MLTALLILTALALLFGLCLARVGRDPRCRSCGEATYWRDNHGPICRECAEMEERRVML